MKRVIGTAVLAIALGAGAGAAQAQSFARPYAELGLGVTANKDARFGNREVDSGREPAARLAFGFDDVIGPVGFRVDYFSTSLGVDLFEDINVQSVMLSAVYNAPVSDWLTLYAGAGAGIAMSDYSGSGLASQFPGVNSEDSQIAVQAFGGARAKLFNSPLSAFVEAQYHASDDFEITPTATAEYSSLSAMAGLRWNF